MAKESKVARTYRLKKETVFQVEALAAEMKTTQADVIEQAVSQLEPAIKIPDAPPSEGGRKMWDASTVPPRPPVGRIKNVSVPKTSKRQKIADALKASDPMGAERGDIAFGTHEELPSGGSVAVVGAARPTERAQTDGGHFHSGVLPKKGCAECAEMVKK